VVRHHTDVSEQRRTEAESERRKICWRCSSSPPVVWPYSDRECAMWGKRPLAGGYGHWNQEILESHYEILPYLPEHLKETPPRSGWRPVGETIGWLDGKGVRAAGRSSPGETRGNDRWHHSFAQRYNGAKGTELELRRFVH
jgi:hypothetical protein